MADLADTLRRVQRIDAALASAEGLHVETIADELGVHARSVRRYLADLIELGIPIIREPHTNLVIYRHTKPLRLLNVQAAAIIGRGAKR